MWYRRITELLYNGIAIVSPAQHVHVSSQCLTHVTFSELWFRNAMQTKQYKIHKQLVYH